MGDDTYLALLATPCSARGAVVPETPRGQAKVVEPAISEAEACEVLRLAVIRAATRSAGSIKELRVAIEQFTVTFRKAGNTPEAVLIRLKKVIEQRSTHGFLMPANGLLSPILCEQITTWCIQDYFRKSEVQIARGPA